MRGIGIVVVSGLAVFASSAVAQDSSGPIHACVHLKNGKTRIVEGASSCTSKERHLAWNRESDAQLVGLTAATLKGDAGVIGFTQACQQEFPGTRFCSSQEVVRTIAVPSGLSGSAWVLTSGGVGLGTGVLVDASGAIGSGNNLSCEGWLIGVGNQTGLAVDFGVSAGSFSLQLCSEARKVACCGWPSN